MRLERLIFPSLDRRRTHRYTLKLKMKTSFKSAAAILSAAALGLSSCSSTGLDDPWTSLFEEAGIGSPVRITATFYPLYDMVNKVLGNTCEDGEFASDLLGLSLNFAGESDPHEYDPSDPQRLALASDSVLLISLMSNFDSWADSIAEGGMTHVKVAEVSGLTDLDGDPIDGEQGSIDPHVWLSPRRMVSIFDAIADAVIDEFSEIQEDAISELEANAAEFSEALVQLDADYSEALAPYEGSILFTSHEAFSYLCLDYGLEQFGIADFADSIPGPDRLAEMEDLIFEMDVHTIYVESLDSSRAVDTVIEDLGLMHPGYEIETRELSALETLSEEDLWAGEDYVSVMYRNLAEIVAGMEDEG